MAAADGGLRVTVRCEGALRLRGKEQAEIARYIDRFSRIGVNPGCSKATDRTPTFRTGHRYLRSTEFKEIAHECAYGRYHINFESVYVETEAEDDQTTPRLLVTSLVNKAMPLIRFDIGDYAKLGHDACACGRESPYLIDIAGREAEFLQLADGRRLSPYLLTTAVETAPGLVKYQFVQHADLALGTQGCLCRVVQPG